MWKKHWNIFFVDLAIELTSGYKLKFYYFDDVFVQ